MIDETKRILYPNDAGGVSIVNPAPKKALERVLGEITQEEYEAHILERSIPEGVPFEIVDASEIPADRVFRDAWEYDDAG